MAKILVVDDDPSILELLNFLAAKQGHDVVTAVNGTAGLAQAKAEKPDLIILDVMMPEMDGFGVSAADCLKTLKCTEHPNPTVLTAKGTSREIFKLVPNVRAYMDKPFDPPDLLKTIRQLLLKVYLKKEPAAISYAMIRRSEIKLVFFCIKESFVHVVAGIDLGGTAINYTFLDNARHALDRWTYANIQPRLKKDQMSV